MRMKESSFKNTIPEEPGYSDTLQGEFRETEPQPMSAQGQQAPVGEAKGMSFAEARKILFDHHIVQDVTVDELRIADKKNAIYQKHFSKIAPLLRKIDPDVAYTEGKIRMRLPGENMISSLTLNEARALIHDPEGVRVAVPREMQGAKKSPILNEIPTVAEVRSLHDNGPDTVPNPIPEFDIERTLSPDHIRAIYDKYRPNLDTVEEQAHDVVWTPELLDIAHQIDPKSTLSPDGKVVFHEPNGHHTLYTAKEFKEYLHVLANRPDFIKLMGIVDRAREKKRREKEVRQIKEAESEKVKLEEAFGGFGVSREQLREVQGFDALDIPEKKVILKTLHTLLRESALLKAKEEIVGSRKHNGAGPEEVYQGEILARAKEIERSALFGRVEEFIGSLVVHLGNPETKQLLLEGKGLNGLARSFGQHMLTESEAATTQPDAFHELAPNTSTPLNRETKRERPTTPFNEVFTKEFGIQREDLESIGGYERLSEGQRALLFENFKALTLGSVPEEASRLYEASRAADREEKVLKYGKLFGGAVAALREAFAKESSLELGERDAVKRMRTGGFEIHKDTLKQLVKSAATYGPRVHVEKGELEIDFINLRERATGKARGPEWRAMKDFNTQAHAFARIPEAWRGNTLGVDDGKESRFASWFKSRFSTEYKNQQKFAAAEAAYQDARLHLTRTWKRQGKSDQEIARHLMDADARVSQQQTLHTAPEAIEALAAVEDTSLWKQVAKRVVTNGNLGYMALGFVGRTLAGAAVGVLGAPIAAAGIASARSWNKTAAELRERDRLAREGVRDTDPEYKKMLDEMNSMHDAHVADPTNIEKERRYRTSVEQFTAYRGNGALNVVSAVEYITVHDKEGMEVRMDRGLIQKTIELIEQYRVLERAGVEDTNRREKILKSLRERVDYINDKQRLGRVNYGSREERIAHQTRLYAVLGEALAIIADTDAPENKRLKERLAQKLSRTEARIRGVRREYRSTELQLSAYKAAGFSIGGALLAHAFQDLEVVKKIRSVFGGGDVREPETVPQRVTVDGSLVEPMVAQGSAHVTTLEENTPTQMSPLGVHLVQEGDTLMKILREQVPEIDALGTRQSRDTAIMNLLKSLSIQELVEIGVKSKDPDLIRIGERIDLEKVSALLTKKGLLSK